MQKARGRSSLSFYNDENESPQCWKQIGMFLTLQGGDGEHLSEVEEFTNEPRELVSVLSMETSLLKQATEMQ